MSQNELLAIAGIPEERETASSLSNREMKVRDLEAEHHAPAAAPAPTKHSADLHFKRDATGLIESVTGTDAAGQRVQFDFRRDGRRKLDKIKVRR